MSKPVLYPHVPQGKKIGYRRGAIGDYTGGTPKLARVAWRALDYEYRELGNEGTLDDLAIFLGMTKKVPLKAGGQITMVDTPIADWPTILAEFRRRYGDIHGIWLSRTKKESQLYKEYGELEPVPYNEKDMIIDLGGDGIYVLDRREGYA